MNQHAGDVEEERQPLIEKSKPQVTWQCGIVTALSILLAIFVALTITFSVLYSQKSVFSPWRVSYFDKDMKFGFYHFYQLQVGDEFRILNLADIQLNREFTDLDRRTIAQVIETAKPDLITLTGDQFENTAREFADSFTAFMDSFGIFWAPVHGNHDRQLFSNAEVGHAYEQGKYCLYRNGFEENITGNGNYIISLMQGEENVYNLFFLDSGAEVTLPDYTLMYDYIHQDQIDWYEWAVKGLNERFNKTVKSIVFQHIPLMEYTEAAEHILFGEKHETVSSSKHNSGFFDSLLKMNSTTHMIVGHDHINNYFGLYQGIILGYAMKTGLNSYTRPEMNGGTLIKIADGQVSIEHVYYKD